MLIRNAESTSTLVAGSGLSGGGPLNSGSDVTLDIGAGTGITVGADSISLSASYLGANPTGTVGLSVVNGSATTYMRSDAAPPLDVGITPTWTGIHTFSAQDVHNAGASLGTSGNLATARAASTTVGGFDLQDTVSRATGDLTYVLRNSANGNNMMVVTGDGRFSFGYTTGAAAVMPQVGHVLSFLSNDAFSQAGSPTYVGILALVTHSDTAETVPELIGLVGAVSAQAATGLSAVVVNGVTGSASSNVPAALTGKVLACFSGAFAPSATLPNMEPLTKDINFGKNAHPAGGYDHMTVLWAPTVTTSNLTGYPSDANRPGIVSSARLCIQDWGAGSAAGSAFGEYWAIRGEDSKGATATFPAQTGYIKMTYPRRTGGTTPPVHACHAYLEPWPITTTIRTGALDGDLVFDDGSNFRKGLWEYAGAWYKLLQHKSVDAISGAAGPATLALTTGGATGPATAAQNTWLQIVGANGTAYWVPAWV